MTTDVKQKPKGHFARVARALSKSRMGRALGEAFGLTIDTIERSLYWIFLTGIIGGLLSVTTPYLISAPAIIGQMMADWCVLNGDCNYYTNMTSLAVGLFISASIGVYGFSMLFWHRNRKQSVVGATYNAVRDADKDGVSVESIQAETGLEFSEAFETLASLMEAGEVVVKKAQPGQRTPVYRLAKFGRYDDEPTAA